MARASIITLCILIFGSSAGAFNWQKCKPTSELGGLFRGGLLFSTTSYISSTGNCAMIGQLDHDRKVFLTANLDRIKRDSARGEGEYLDSYANLLGCPAPVSTQFSSAVQRNFVKIYGSEISDDPEAVHNSFEYFKNTEPFLKQNCMKSKKDG